MQPMAKKRARETGESLIKIGNSLILTSYTDVNSHGLITYISNLHNKKLLSFFLLHSKLFLFNFTQTVTPNPFFVHKYFKMRLKFNFLNSLVTLNSLLYVSAPAVSKR